jgi:hypothetical protein
MPSFSGLYHIIWMEQWEQDFVNMDGQGFVRIDVKGQGEFHFGCCQCSMDWRADKRDGKPGIEFTFDGNDEMTPVTGRGWASWMATN